MTSTSVVAMSVMLLIHGFVLDVIIIGLVPMISASAANGSRAALFPWTLGGYPGFIGPGYPFLDKLPNLHPCHRRFIAENAAYAVLRGGAGIYALFDGANAVPALTMAVASHWAEAVTIAWEIFTYGCPPDAAPPMTLMGIFSTWTLLTVMNNDDYFTVDPASLTAMQIMVGLTWCSWLVGVMGILKNKNNTGRSSDYHRL